MTTTPKFLSLAAAGALLVAGAATPASAGSPMSDAFVANVRPNVIFLDVSSRLAMDKSPSRAVRQFAHTEAKEQTIAANSITAWTQISTYRGEAVALGGAPYYSPLAPVAVPVDVAAATTASILTGRSVAVDTPLTVTPVGVMSTVGPTVGSQLLPAQRDDLARLMSQTGSSFNGLYKSTQLDGLLQLSTLYSDYARNGDDPALRDLANSELPKISQRIRELRRL